MDLEFESIKEEDITCIKLNVVQETDCSICLEHAITDEDDLMTLPFCGHTFHEKCITKWFIKQKNCPICRQTVYQNNHDIYIIPNVQHSTQQYSYRPLTFICRIPCSDSNSRNLVVSVSVISVMILIIILFVFRLPGHQSIY